MIDTENPTLTLTVHGVTFSVAFDRVDAAQHDRMRYLWEIAAEGANVRDAGDDLTCVGEPDLCEALRTLIVFAECGDRGALFPNLHAAGLDFDELHAGYELGGDPE